MTTVLPLIGFWASAATLAYLYVGYPALLLILQRQGRERILALPALAIGIGLASSSRWSRGRRRRALLLALRQGAPPAAGS